VNILDSVVSQDGFDSARGKGQGSITSLTNGSAATVATYVYDAFGNLSASTGLLTNVFRYTARELVSLTIRRFVSSPGATTRMIIR